MTNISFQGRSIMSCNPQDYIKACNIAEKYSNNLGLNRSQKLSVVGWRTLETDNSQLAVIITNGNIGMIDRFSLTRSIDENINKLRKQVYELLKNNKDREIKAKKNIKARNSMILNNKLTAWIIGGDKCSGVYGDKTIKCLNTIADEICDRPDIDTSILVGSKSGNDEFGIHCLKDRVEIVINEKNKQNLDDYFDIVELNDTQEVPKIEFINSKENSKI